MSTVLWVKQYGLERSGTNYAKALVELSQPDVRVLATVLGSKHATPDLDSQIRQLKSGDVGIAVTDLTETELADIVAAYEDGRMGVMLCVRDAVTWIDAYERHLARRHKRETGVLGRERLAAYATQWLGWIYEMTAWSAACELRSMWVLHHEVVRKPQQLLDNLAHWGAAPQLAARVNYLKKAGDRHASENLTNRPYRTRQYRDIYSGLGQIGAADVEGVCDLITRQDHRGLSAPYMWDRRPLRHRRAGR